MNKKYLIFLIILTTLVIVESTLIIKRLTMGEKLPSLELVLEERQKAKLIFNSFEEPIAGIDAILNFDPALVKVEEIRKNNDLFNQIVVNRQKEEQGRIKITAYMPMKLIKGNQVLAFLTVRLLKNQPAKINLEFLGKGKPADSNLISQTSQKDILAKVVPLELEKE